MNQSQLLALYEQDQRINVSYPDAKREALAHVVRHTALREHGNGSIIYSRLTTDMADSVIREQIDYFQQIGQHFEWKLYDYDRPPNLKVRLAAHGFMVEEPEAIMVLPLDGAPDFLWQPVTHDIRQITTVTALADVLTVQREVWDEDFAWLEEYVGGVLSDNPTQMSVYVAYVDGQPASAAWTYFPLQGQFASLWGGSTVARFRKQGLYSALLSVRAQEAKSRGINYLTVDASPMSRPILEKLGFTTVAIAYPCHWKGQKEDETHFSDDDLEHFALEGTSPLPQSDVTGSVEHDGAHIWYAAYGSGAPVILLHGGLGHSGNWSYQVPALVAAGYRPIVIDSRGHGRSTRDSRPYTYELMASDVIAMMDHLEIAEATFVGWSDGACTAMILAAQVPARVTKLLYFACNMDPSGTKPFVFTPILGRCFSRHQQEYAERSATPDHFQDFVDAVTAMQQSEPNFTAHDLAQIQVPITIIQSDTDEFIKREHSEYLAATIPNAEFVLLYDVSHFAPLQRPDYFNQVVLAFLG